MLAVLQYQTAVMRGDFDSANVLLPNIPESEYTKVARFLESQGFKEEAFAVTTDPDHKFDPKVVGRVGGEIEREARDRSPKSTFFVWGGGEV